MSNKSLFDKLFEEVMQDDAEALGLPAPGESEGVESGMEGEVGGEDEVTLTMDRATAQKLHDLLAQVLGTEEEVGEEEGEGGEEGEGEEGGEEEDMESYGSEDAESESEGDDDEEKSDEDSEEKGALKESPQSQYVKFETEGKAAALQKKGNNVVGGAVAAKVSGQGSPEKTAQTQGTAHYMPFKHKVDDGRGSMVVKSKMTKPSGEGESMFHAK